MDENRIRQIAREEAQAAQTKGQFKLQRVARHIHNNVDAPTIYQPTLIYTGQVGYDGTAILLPNGWTVEAFGSGAYEITHNLNTLLYTVVASPEQSTNEVVVPVVECLQNILSISWFKSIDETPTDTSFNFILVNTSNKMNTNPNYRGVNI